MHKKRHNLIQKTFIMIAVICALTINIAVAGLSQDEAYLMINRLLRIDNPEFITHHKDGTKEYNSLNEYKAWEQLYIKYSKYEQADKTLSKEDARILLYIGMIAKLNHDSSLSGSFSSDLMPIYDKNKNLVLSTLNDLDYLIPSTCYFLNRYFGYEGKHSDKKDDFIKANSNLIAKALGDKKHNQCMSYFKS